MKTPPNIADDQFLDNVPLASRPTNCCELVPKRRDVHSLSSDRVIKRPDVEEKHRNDHAYRDDVDGQSRTA
jgi:hypothetical protein